MWKRATCLPAFIKEKGFGPGQCKVRFGFVVDLEIEHIVSDQREHHAIAEDSMAAKHPPEPRMVSNGDPTCTSRSRAWSGNLASDAMPTN